MQDLTPRLREANPADSWVKLFRISIAFFEL